MTTPITSLLRQIGLFEHMSEETLGALIDASEQQDFAAGALIFNEGDVADAMYVILEGAVQIFTEIDGRVVVLAKSEAGVFFGEQALLPGRSGRRNASVRAYSASRLLRISKAHFQARLANDDPLKEQLLALGDRQLQERVALQAQLFRSLELYQPFESAEEVFFQPGETVFQQGDEADRLYVILHGKAQVYQTEADQTTQLASLGVGQCFGELGLVNRQPRAATVVAEEPLHLLAIDGQPFLDLYEQSPDLRDYVQTLQRIYQLPGLGTVSQHRGQFMDLDCVTTHYRLLDMRQFIGSQVVGQQIYNLEQVVGPQAEPTPPRTYRFQDIASDSRRELRISPTGAIQGMTVFGPWTELPGAHMKAIEGHVLPDELLALFEQTGSIGIEEIIPTETDDELVCTCVRVQRGRIREAVQAGVIQLAGLQAQLGCGTVCGACIPSLMEMLGQKSWTLVTIIDERPVVEGIRTFRFRPITGEVLPALPGQHIVIQGRIDKAWVQRAYTLSSPCDNRDYYEFTVKREPLGVFSRWLFDTPASERQLRASSPQGDYYWEPNDNPVVCLVAGIGVTPALSILRTIVRQGRSTPLHIHYSARRANEFAYREEMEAAAADHPNIALTLQETSRQGRLSQDVLAALVEQYAGAEFFLCGPEPYLNSITEALCKHGVPAERIHVEVFTYAGDPPSVPSPTREAAGQHSPPPPLKQSNLLVAPQPVKPRRLRQALLGVLSMIHSAANALAFDWRGDQRRPQPLLGMFDWVATRASGVDANLPRDYLGMLGEPGKGSLQHMFYSFARATKSVGANKQQALEARARGEALAPTTPDGDTVVFTVPRPPLKTFTGRNAVDTGWKEADDHHMMSIYFIKGPTALGQVLGDSPAFDRGPLPYHYLQQALGCAGMPSTETCKAAGLFAGQFAHNETWENDRGFVSKMFGYDALNALGDGMEVALESIVKEIDHHIDTTPERVVDFNVMTTRIAFRMLLQASFGNIELDEFVALGAVLTERMREALDFVQTITTGQMSNVSVFNHSIDEAKKTIGRMVDIIRDLHEAGELTAFSLTSPLVQLIVYGDENGAWSVDRLFAVIFPTIFGGHETTGHTLAWALYEMGRNRDLRAQVQREVDDYRQRHDGRGIRPPQYTERPCALALLYEILRRHPPSVLIPRTATVTGDMPPDPETGIGAFHYRRGAVFLCAIAAAHRDPSVYADPDAFRIERFFDGYTDDKSQAEHGRLVMENARKLEAARRLLTFGAGHGTCPGRGFNMLEFFLVLDALLPRFIFELEHPEREVGDYVEIIAGPEPGKLGGYIRRRR